MLRLVLLVLAVVCLVLAAFSVSSPTVNGHAMSWFYMGLAFWAASFIDVNASRRNPPA